MVYRKRQKLAVSGVTGLHGLTDSLERIDCSELTFEDFVNHFEKPKKPVVITGLCKSWPAVNGWSEEALMRRHAEHRFKVAIVVTPHS